jgi:asparagine N-glycosylation enzyme membrane subunit Stt3
VSGDLQLKRPSIGLTVGFWLIVAVFATAARWSELQQLMFGSPDDLARLVQVRDLLAGQSWWDLTQERIGSSGVEMHWSRHLDGLVSVVVLLLRPIIGAKSAELIALILVPLGLLLAFLWLVSSIGRLLTPLRDAGLYAMVAGALGVGVLHRFLPGALDHHGLQIVLVLTVVWAVITTPSRRAAVIAGVAAGLAPTVGLETVPILAGVIAGLGIEWAIGGGRPRGFFQMFYLSALQV